MSFCESLLAKNSTHNISELVNLANLENVLLVPSLKTGGPIESGLSVRASPAYLQNRSKDFSETRREVRHP